jgi:hypothetical protein
LTGFRPHLAKLFNAREWARSHPGAVVEIGVAVALTLAIVSAHGPVVICLALISPAGQGLASIVRLMATDAAGVLATGAAALARAALLVAPLVLWARTWPRYRFVWLPLAVVPFSFFFGLSFPAISTPTMWVLFVAAAVVGALAARRPRIGWLALAPVIVCAEPALSHTPINERVWTHERLEGRCASNDGARPEGFRPSMTVARYYSVTRLDDDLALLAGERGSHWLRRRADGRFAIEEPSRVSGNLWQGCLWGRSIWFTRKHLFLNVERRPDGAQEHERITRIDVPDPPGMVEYDFAEPACDPDHDRLFATELVGGGIREVRVSDRTVQRHQLAGFNLQFMRRADGALVGIDTARLVVFDPDSKRTLEEHAAGFGLMGLDVCLADDAVAIADMAGRVRLFERAPSGPYRFVRGAALAAPRRIAFSPDCRLIGVTSGDDQTVWVLRRADLAVTGTYRVGPGLRDLAWVAAREIAVADACTATLLAAVE